MDLLAERESGPMPKRGDFATADDYLRAWYLWRAISRDGRLTDAERDVVLWVQAERLGLEAVLAEDMAKPY